MGAFLLVVAAMFAASAPPDHPGLADDGVNGSPQDIAGIATNPLQYYTGFIPIL
jgi:hypothetical protein